MADEFQPPRSSDETSSEWIRTELESVDIGDKRLNARVVRVIDKFWKQPQASIPKATGSWSGAKAAYRLLSNPKVTPEKVLAPHLESVRSRMEGHRVVLAGQDTTDLNFTSHPATEGLGTIGSSPKLRGMHVHTTVAVTPERVPLGLIQHQTWIRPENEFGKKTERRKKVFEEKESVKWLHSLQAVEQLQAKLPDVQFISAGDREADIYDLFKHAAGMKADRLVRASSNRRLECEEEYLWEHVEAQPVAQELEMRIPVKKSKKWRTATLELRFAPVAICAPRYRHSTEEPILLSAVYVRVWPGTRASVEAASPSGQKNKMKNRR